MGCWFEWVCVCVCECALISTLAAKLCAVYRNANHTQGINFKVLEYITWRCEAYILCEHKLTIGWILVKIMKLLCFDSAHPLQYIQYSVRADAAGQPEAANTKRWQQHTIGCPAGGFSMSHDPHGSDCNNEISYDLMATDCCEAFVAITQKAFRGQNLPTQQHCTANGTTKEKTKDAWKVRFNRVKRVVDCCFSRHVDLRNRLITKFIHTVLTNKKFLNYANSKNS